MTLKYTQGCTADSLTVDDKEWRDLDKEARLQVLSRMFDFLKGRVMNDIFDEVISYILDKYGDYERHYCDCCGGGYTTKLEI